MSRTEARRDKLRWQLRKGQLDALLVSHPPNVSYLTGFSGDSSYLVVGSTRTLLVSDGRFAEQIALECPGLEMYVRRTTGEKMSSALKKVLARMKVRRLGFEADAVTIAERLEWEREMPRMQLFACFGAVELLRSRKDAEEVRSIRDAIAVAERAFQQFRTSVRAGVTEKEAADEMELHLRRSGAERSAFDTIVAVGAHAAQGHARPDSRLLLEGQPIIVDWGAAGRFYKSDLTRVLALRRIPPKLEAAYEVVLRAQERALQAIRPGIQAKDVDAEARAVMEESGFGRFFTHSTGHGLGLEIHEAPALRPNSETILQPGMVVTVEPGVYVRGWGGVRIEDDVLVTRCGHELLSSLPKDLASILIA